MLRCDSISARGLGGNDAVMVSERLFSCLGKSHITLNDANGIHISEIITVEGGVL